MEINKLKPELRLLAGLVAWRIGSSTCAGSPILAGALGYRRGSMILGGARGYTTGSPIPDSSQSSHTGSMILRGSQSGRRGSMILSLSLLFLFAFSYNSFSQGFTDINLTLGLPGGYYNGEYGGGISFVDFNQDGLDDLTIPTGEGLPIHFYVNNGTGYDELAPLVDNFTEVKQVLWVDYDNDGDFDLYTTSHSLNRLYKNTGDLNFVDITATAGFNDPIKQSFCGSWLDYDEDGLLDLCISHRTSHLVGHIKLYHNLGNDQFEDETAAAGLSDLGNSVLAMTTFDMNNDGWEDIFVGQDYQAGCLMLKNNGDGTFDNISVSSNTAIQNNTMTTTIGDYNNDGWLDIYLTNTPEGSSFLENQGDETFIEKAVDMDVGMVGQFCWGGVYLDADNDMDLDLHLSTPDGSFIFENPGDGQPFVEVTNSWGFAADDNYSVGAAIGDYNGDGAVDFCENNGFASTHSFWQNNFTQNNYIVIDLQGTVSNVNAVGAVVHVHAGGVHQMRRVGCGEGFSSQNSLSQFFGLGANTLIDSITVKWPNGLEISLPDVSANQRITMIEEFDPDAGCTDPLACNYNPLATNDNGSCFYAETYYDCAGNCLNDTDNDGVCDELEISGCTDATACNYNPDATDDDNSCSYPDLYYDCAGNCLNDTDNDGVCDELEIPGCLDATACNYNPGATDDDGSCSYLQTFPINGDVETVILDPYVYTYPATSGSAYFWELSGVSGNIISGQGSSVIEVVWELPGVSIITVKETNSSDCEITASITITVAELIDVQELEAHGIQIYPNPVADVLHIDPGDWSGQNVLIEIYDVNGRLVLQRVKSEAASLIDLNLEGVANGVYQIVLSRGGELVLGRILVWR